MTTVTTACPPYSDAIQVRFSDTDAQGHLCFANYLVYADEVAGVYMESLGLGAIPIPAAFRQAIIARQPELG